MPPWLIHVKSAQRKEPKSGSSRWVQLATMGIDNNPRVRTVVFRGWSKSYEMEILTDKRSQKYQELNLNNNVEICWLFSKSKCQFRFRGKSSFDFGKDKHRYWKQLTDDSKTMWSWPFPGEKYVFNDKKEISEKKNELMSMNFSLLKIEVDYVDQLILSQPIHIRKRWIRKEEWSEERINP